MVGHRLLGTYTLILRCISTRNWGTSQNCCGDLVWISRWVSNDEVLSTSLTNNARIGLIAGDVLTTFPQMLKSLVEPVKCKPDRGRIGHDNVTNIGAMTWEKLITPGGSPAASISRYHPKQKPAGVHLLPQRRCCMVGTEDSVQSR